MAYYQLEKLVKASFSPSQIHILLHTFQYIIRGNNLFSEHFQSFSLLVQALVPSQAAIQLI